MGRRTRWDGIIHAMLIFQSHYVLQSLSNFDFTVTSYPTTISASSITYTCQNPHQIEKEIIPSTDKTPTSHQSAYTQLHSSQSQSPHHHAFQHDTSSRLVQSLCPCWAARPRYRSGTLDAGAQCGTAIGGSAVAHAIAFAQQGGSASWAYGGGDGMMLRSAWNRNLMGLSTGWCTLMRD